MSVTNTPRKAGPYTGNNTDVQFVFGFKVFADSDLVVTRAVIATGAESTLVLTTDYSVTRNANQDNDPGGYITLTTALASTYTLTLTSAVPDTQPAVFTNLGGFFPAVLNNALDRLTILVQQISEKVNRSLKLAVSTPTGFDAQLPAPVPYGVLGFNAAATGFAVTDPSGASALSSDLASASDAAKGPALMGLNPTLNYVAGTIGARLKTTISVKDFPWLAKGDGTTDDATAINAAIAAAGNGGHVHFPAGTYLAQSPILAENIRGLTIAGESGQYGFSGARIIGKHTGKATLSMVGSLFCDVSGISIEGDTSSKPVTGLLLGRSSAASAGNHTFTNVHVQGYFQKCGLYNVASEENTFVNCYIVPTTATLAGLYMSQGDGFAVGGLTASSMETNTFIGGTIGNGDNTAGTTGLYIDCGAATGHHQFLGTFLTKNGGDSFVLIRLGATDGLDTLFPISFYNVIGEHNVNQPTTGLHFVSASSKILAGFTAKNIRFQNPSTNNILCDGGGTVYLVGADISTPYMSGGKPSVLHRLDASDLSLLSESGLTIATLNSSELLHNTTPTITSQTTSKVRDLSGTQYGISAALTLSNQTTTTTAPGAGGAGALPATPAGYITMNINGTARKLPYY